MIDTAPAMALEHLPWFAAAASGGFLVFAASRVHRAGKPAPDGDAPQALNVEPVFPARPANGPSPETP